MPGRNSCIETLGYSWSLSSFSRKDAAQQNSVVNENTGEGRGGGGFGTHARMLPIAGPRVPTAAEAQRSLVIPTGAAWEQAGPPAPFRFSNSAFIEHQLCTKNYARYRRRVDK